MLSLLRIKNNLVIEAQKKPNPMNIKQFFFLDQEFFQIFRFGITTQFGDNFLPSPECHFLSCQLKIILILVILKNVKIKIIISFKCRPAFGVERWSRIWRDDRGVRAVRGRAAHHQDRSRRRSHRRIAVHLQRLRCSQGLQFSCFSKTF